MRRVQPALGRLANVARGRGREAFEAIQVALGTPVEREAFREDVGAAAEAAQPFGAANEL